MADRLADFYIIGAPKCGTTFLYRALREHPGVFMTDPKEPNRYGSDLDLADDRSIRDSEEYGALFDRADENQRLGEASVFSMYSERAAEEISRETPGALFIALIRDPVEFVRSMHWQALTTRNEQVESLGEALALQEERARGESIPGTSFFPSALQYEKLADFEPQLRRFIDLFGRERLRVFTLEELSEDPDRVHAECCRLIGADPSFHSSFADQNAARPMRNVRIRNLLANNPRVRRAVGLLPKRFRRALGEAGGRIGGDRERAPGMDPELRAELCERLRPGVDALEELLGRSFGSWARLEPQTRG